MSRPPQQPSSQVRFVTASENDAGQRIDNFLMRHFKGVPKSHIYRILRKGEVRVNKKRIKPTYKLVSGDEVRLPPVRISAPRDRRPPDGAISSLAQRIVYDDNRLIVLNKPAGLAVHAGSGIDFGVIDIMQRLEKHDSELYLVHRLDRDTSGCLLLARDRDALRSLQASMQENRIEKVYLALVKGQWEQQDHRVEMPLRRNKIRGGERLVQIDDDGKQSVSEFRTIRQYTSTPDAGGCSLMKIRLITGRTHQIRVQASESSHPVAGDRRYGDEQFNRKMKDYGLKRMFLHAASLSFPHPDNDKEFKIEPPLDDDLQQVLDNLNR
ncbi:MAG TPA: RluA family pseudouridine synthase [Gammaproteobacteria bacterium]|jgi:23S rRNA pseudouridine955/2504/2580 synthase